ncbi:MAG TPA: FlgD immunoglobulin-like domain containing protein [bacterium]|nr:FlgD immunoglobulin-like domain containing protein [bacterium]HPG44114.1 FlgD immunoglobulin-like domain containing protein [bacterium]HPM96480.1 FlgD immunoglobulin-like domain containing protein [bacterium]
MKRKKFSICLFGMALALVSATVGSAMVIPVKDASQELATQLTAAADESDLRDAVQGFRSMERKIEISITEAVRERAVMQKIERQIDSQLRPEMLVPSFLESLHRMQVDEDGHDRLQPLQKWRQQSTASNGALSGTVKVDGSAPNPAALILAFDTHGYFVGSGETDLNGDYAIGNLPVGSYYVLATGESFVNAIYPDVISPLGSRATWRQASLVAVSEGTTTFGINFSLQSGYPVKVIVYYPDGLRRFEDQNVWFTITPADDPTMEISQLHNESNGLFNLRIPTLGAVKIAAQVSGYLNTWYPGVDRWDLAGTITADPSGQTPLISFNLLPIPDQPATGGIQGQVKSVDYPISVLALVFVFDAEDTSFVAMNNVLELNGIFGSYSIGNLLPGSYYVYANDYLGSLLGAGDYLGEFYSGARTPSEATLVQVVADEVIEDINFELSPGGSISGQIKNASGEPVDSLIIFAVHADLGGPGKDPFLSRVQLGLAVTNWDGRYEIAGLPDGDYVLRTFSNYQINVDDLTDFSNLIVTGKHADKICDEYYGGAYNLFDFKKAARVPVVVGQKTENIDFNLAPVGTIHGSIHSAQGGEPISDAVILALDAESGYPHLLQLSSGYESLPGKKIDDQGRFRLMPLPPGNYRLLALSGLENDDRFLSEFYDGVHDFNQSPVISLNGNVVENIDFTLVPGATVQGFVHLSEGFAAGADTVNGFPVIAFDSSTGRAVGYDYVQFTGGYRIDRLPAGDYKIMALPMVEPYGVTYVGGGDHFSDPQAQTVSVAVGQLIDGLDIVLEPAHGSISGTIRDAENGEPLANIGVIAYDATGHIVGFAMSGLDLASGTFLPDEGVFELAGLRSGSYYLRTFSFTQAVSLLATLEQFTGGAMGGGDDIIGQVGGLFSTVFNLDIDLSIYQDNWYSGIDANLEFNLTEFIFDLTRYGFVNEYDTALLPLHVPLPFAMNIPAGVSPVQVNESTPTTGINFDLVRGDIDDQVTDVADQPAVPTEFMVSANYPNPFNPTTQLRFSLPQAADMRIEIFDNLGRRVSTLVDRTLAAGSHQVTWNGADETGQSCAAGVYFARFAALQQQKIVKMLLLK